MTKKSHIHTLFDSTPRHPTYIVAELSANHCNDLNLAIKTIEAMKESCADAVKVQTFRPESITLDSEKEWFQTRKDTIWAGQKLYDLYKKAALPYEWHAPLQEKSHELGMDFFSTPFDLEGVDFLETLNISAYKIASLEINHIPLIRKAAETGKPIILSTGAATIDDIDLAVATCKEANNDRIAILKCTSAYPTPFEEVNLSVIPEINRTFRCIPGLSDHTLGVEIPIASVTLGAKIVEKHFILDRRNGGVDADFSLEPDEFKSMVEAIRNVEKALGDPEFKITPLMEKARTSMRSVFAVKDIKSGELFTEENLRILRPGIGLHPKYYEELIGRKAKTDLEKGDPVFQS